MSTTTSHTSATSAASMATNAGSLVPFPETFIQTTGSSTITTAIVLVGQILDDAQTNFVGYDNGSAEYLYTSSHAGASETTLAGSTYYVSAGAAPAGYLATGGSGSASSGSIGTAASSETGAGVASTTKASTTGSSGSSSTTASSSRTSSASSASASSTKSSAGVKVCAGAVFTVVVGLVAVLVNSLA